MKEIPLTRGYVALVDDEDYERVMAAGSSYLRRTGKDGRYLYGEKEIGGKNVLLHRFILGLTDPLIFVDHVDHDGLNCTRTNMRICGRTENKANARKTPTRSSPYKGVYLEQKKW